MIKGTFYNLNKDKQERIYNAIKNELINKGWDNGKVVSICKNANIQRSAFYRYFDCLDDAFVAFLKHIKNEKAKEVKSILLKGNKDIFEKSKSMLLDLLENEDIYLIIKNVNKSEQAMNVVKSFITPEDSHNISNSYSKSAVVTKSLMRMCRQLAIEYYEMAKDKDSIIKDFNLFVEMCKYGYKNISGEMK